MMVRHVRMSWLLNEVFLNLGQGDAGEEVDQIERHPKTNGEDEQSHI